MRHLLPLLALALPALGDETTLYRYDLPGRLRAVDWNGAGFIDFEYTRLGMLQNEVTLAAAPLVPVDVQLAVSNITSGSSAGLRFRVSHGAADVARDIKLVVTMPAGVTPSLVGGSASATLAGNQLTFHIGSRQSFSEDIDVFFNFPSGVSIVTGEIITPSDPADPNNTQTGTLNGAPDIRLELVQPALDLITLTPGQSAHFEAKVINNSPMPVSSFRISGATSLSSATISGTTASQGTITPSGTGFIIDPGTLAAGAHMTVSYILTASDATSLVQSIGFTVTAVSGSLLNTSDDSARATVVLASAPGSGNNRIVTSTADSGPGSLREAISTGGSGSRRITFDFPGPGPAVINLITPLPEVTGRTFMTIDGSTAPGGRVVLNGGGLTGNGLVFRSATFSADDNTVRGLVIHNFNGHGIVLDKADFCFVEDCLIGTGADGQSAAPNTGHGIFLRNLTSRAAIRRCVISGNGGHGIFAAGAQGTETDGQHSITQCVIGLAADGSTPLPNGQDGIRLEGSSRNVIGPANVLSGNSGAGIFIAAGAAGLPSFGNSIAGNFIGTGTAGLTAKPNAGGGIVITGGPETLIGGPVPILSSIPRSVPVPQQNVISGNTGAGVRVEGLGVTLHGNIIGLGSDGLTPLANTGDGVLLSSLTGSIIGGTLAGQPNTISHNGGAGVNIAPTATGVRLSGNLMRNNTQPGIDLGGDGHTANDAGDGDDGANFRQNHPLLTPPGENALSVSGTLNARPNATHRIEVFRSLTNIRGRADALLGSTQITTGAGGSVTFTVPLTTAPAAGQFLTATATAADGSTSEFSPPVPVAADPGDTDSDGLPDAWEQQFFAGLSAGAVDDPDADGASNADEFAAATNPVNPASVFTILSVGMAGNSLTVTFDSQPQRHYRLQRSTDLRTWQPAGGIISGDGTALTLTDPAVPGPRAHYRIEVSE